MARLSEIAELIMGQSPPSSTYNDSGEGLPFFQGKTDFGFRFPTNRLYCNEPRKTSQPGDILISVRAPVGPTNLSNARSCIGRGLAAIRPQQIDGHFLYYALRYQEESIAALGTGSTFKSINKAQLAGVEIDTEGLAVEEQRVIGAILWAVENAIEHQEKLIALTAELKKALMHKLFTEGTRGEPQKETAIGPIPESWNVASLGELLDKAQYGLSLRAGGAGACPMLRMTNQVDGRILPNDLKYVDLPSKEVAKFRCISGDVLFNRTNSFDLVGRTAIFDLDGDYVFASYLIRLQTKGTRLNPFFLNHYLNWEITQARLKSIASRAVSQSNISATRLKGFQVPEPSTGEQAEMVEHLDLCDATRDQHSRRRGALQFLFRALLHQLMTAQLRVEQVDMAELKALGIEVD